MGQILANWDESDGSPYEYHLDGLNFQVEEPTWQCVPYEERNVCAHAFTS